MLINKITAGFVVQTFDTDLGKFISQEFIAGDQCDYENKETDEPVDASLLHVEGEETYPPVEMKQPN